MALCHTQISTPHGQWLAVDDGQVVLSFDYWSTQESTGSQSLLGQEISRQIEAYLKDKAFQFNLPLKPTGTPFQQRVWQLMQSIPAGEVLTYGEAARELRSSPRAVGGACRANPIPLLIPCHRIVSQQGLGGFSGQTQGREIQLKQWLLQHEGAH